MTHAAPKLRRTCLNRPFGMERLRVGLVLGVAVLAVSLSGCGRRGSLETPSAAAYEPMPQVETATGSQTQLPAPVDPAPAAKRSFFLDFLI